MEPIIVPPALEKSKSAPIYTVSFFFFFFFGLDIGFRKKHPKYILSAMNEYTYIYHAYFDINTYIQVRKQK